MADWLTREQRSRNMASIRSKGNSTTERAFVSILREAGISGWRRHLNLPGKPDFVFRSKRLAIFLDGCFWHGCPRCYRLPQDNRAYWKKKVMGNRRRDRRRSRELRSAGWRVLRFWEHTLKSSRGRSQILTRVRAILSEQRKLPR
ncbi:MAG TPA: very short patch repair endonuclease [Candidatus Dormibacteraeota bacterium]|nr:very short patch repair endonuclease [Candidatus Dormibacteraeota bacterium]